MWGQCRKELALVRATAVGGVTGATRRFRVILIALVMVSLLAPWHRTIALAFVKLAFLATGVTLRFHAQTPATAMAPSVAPLQRPIASATAIMGGQVISAKLRIHVAMIAVAEMV